MLPTMPARCSTDRISRPTSEAISAHSRIDPSRALAARIPSAALVSSPWKLRAAQLTRATLK